MSWPSFNDIWSWKTFDSIPWKSGNGVNIFLLGSNPTYPRVYAAWHTKPQAVFPHTKRYRLVRAICENDINEVKLVMDQGFDPDQEIDYKYGYTPLLLASVLNRATIIDYLLLRGANIDHTDSRGNTALMLSTINWNFEVIKLLVDRGADHTKKDMYGLDVIEKAEHRQLNTIASFFRSQNRRSNLGNSKAPTTSTQTETKSRAVEPKPPQFDVHFKFEKDLVDDTHELYTKKKFYQAKPRVYPFNNFKGIYILSLFSPYWL